MKPTESTSQLKLHSFKRKIKSEQSSIIQIRRIQLLHKDILSVADKKTEKGHFKKDRAENVILHWM